MGIVVIIFLFLCFLGMFVQGQNETYTATLSEQFFTSPNYPSDYSPNLVYDYLITTSYVNHSIILRMIDCEIENNEGKGDCAYDNIKIYDGNDSSVTPETVCCFSSQTNYTFTSTDGVVYVVFKSDNGNQFKGFKMSFLSDGPTTTSSTTTPTTVSTTPTTVSTTVTSTTELATGASASSESKNYTGIIVGTVVGGVNLIAAAIVIYVCFIKKPTRAVSPSLEDVHKSSLRVSHKESSTVVHADLTDKKTGENMTETNIFKMTLPNGHEKASQLSPIQKPLTTRMEENIN